MNHKADFEIGLIIGIFDNPSKHLVIWSTNHGDIDIKQMSTSHFITVDSCTNEAINESKNSHGIFTNDGVFEKQRTGVFLAEQKFRRFK